MSNKTKARQQRNQERVAEYLDARQKEHKPLASVSEIARHLNVSDDTARRCIEDMERTGQVKVGRNQRNRILAGTIRLVQWEPLQ